MANMNLDLVAVTSDDLMPCTRPKFPRGCYKGEFRNHAGKHVCNIYVENHRVYLANPREFGHGEIVAMMPGNYSPKDFERAGGMQVSAAQYIPFWRFKV